MKTVFVNDCAADGCYKKNLGKGKQMCKEHQKMYEEGKAFKAFYGKTVQKISRCCQKRPLTTELLKLLQQCK